MLDGYTRAERRRYIGSSDAAALVGKDPWGRTAGDVWAEKTGRLVTPDTAPPGSAMELGNYLEPAIMAWTEKQIDAGIVRDLFFNRGPLCANLDGLALTARPPGIVEGKALGLLGRPEYLEEFGEAGSDEVPVHICVQVHHQLAVVEALPDWPTIALAYVPVLLGGRGFVLYKVHKSQELCDALVEESERFWRDHVVTDRPPPEAPSLETLRRVRRPIETGVPVDPVLASTWLLAKESTKMAKGLEDAALQSLLVELGDAEVGTCELGTFTYKSQTRAAYTVAETTFRVPRFTTKEKTDARRQRHA